MQTTTTSNQFRLGKSDFIKGLLMAVLGAIAGFIQGMIDAGELTFDWDKIWKLALGSALAYLTKNFFDKPKIVINDAPKETIDAIKEGEVRVEVKKQ